MVRVVLKAAVVIVLVVLLTVVTQVGGLVLVIAMLLSLIFRRWVKARGLRVLAGTSLFVVLYLFATGIVVPLASSRVALPMFETKHVGPLNVWTVLLNRHYVRPQLRDALFRVAARMSEKYPGTVVNYLDASFPFIDGFRLIPHLSHSDGRKVDLALHYEGTNDAPSFIGYGISEEPLEGEPDFPAECASKGFRQYNLLKAVVPQGNKKNFTFDGDRTGDLVRFFSQEPAVSRIFIEPHLVQRLKLESEKIRFHGCWAVRHDDHIHVQIH